MAEGTAHYAEKVGDTQQKEKNEESNRKIFIDVKGISTCLVLFNTKRLENHVYFTSLLTFFVLLFFLDF